MAEVIIIGGGAAGMMAAIEAASNGHKVRLLEKNEKLGKKIYITGKGRCNFTNACDFNTFISNIVSNPKFMYSSLRAFGPEDMIDFIESAGCRTKIERGQRAFPLSDHASDITRALERCMNELGVRTELNTEVVELRAESEKTDEQSRDLGPITEAHGFGITVRKNGKLTEYTTDAVIVATGGLSYPSTGSTGDGYRFAKRLGIELEDVSAALVPLVAAENTDCKALQGVSLKNVSVSISDVKTDENDKCAGSGKKLFESETGELLFTHFGLSGPLILSVSSMIGKKLEKGVRYCLSIDLKPALTDEMLDKRMLRDFEEARNMNIENALSKLLISSLRPVLLKRAEIDPVKKVRDISKTERLALIKAIKAFTFTITGTRGYNEAVITQGGIKVSELDPKTMGSRKYPGLYFAGEVIDVDGFTGGFNLQIAFSTGAAAGRAVLDV